MSQREKPFIHPFTFFVVNFGVEDVIRAFREHNHMAALENLYMFSLALDPHIKKDLEKDIEALMTMRKGNGFTEEKLIEIAGRIYDKLHDAGYFLAAKFVEPRFASPKGVAGEKQEDSSTYQER